jgi:hypothetical protein
MLDGRNPVHTLRDQSVQTPGINRGAHLRADQDEGLLVCLRRNDFCADVFELGISVGMFRAFIRLAIGVARKSEFQHLSTPKSRAAHGIASVGGIRAEPESFSEGARRPAPAQRICPSCSGSASKSSTRSSRRSQGRRYPQPQLNFCAVGALPRTGSHNSIHCCSWVTAILRVLG